MRGLSAQWLNWHSRVHRGAAWDALPGSVVSILGRISGVWADLNPPVDVAIYDVGIPRIVFADFRLPWHWTPVAGCSRFVGPLLQS